MSKVFSIGVSTSFMFPLNSDLFFKKSLTFVIFIFQVSRAKVGKIGIKIVYKTNNRHKNSLQNKTIAIKIVYINKTIGIKIVYIILQSMINCRLADPEKLSYHNDVIERAAEFAAKGII